MKRSLAAAVLTLASACSQLWSEIPGPGAIFPKQIIIAMNQNCVYRFPVLYDKSAPWMPHNQRQMIVTRIAR
jgi:hypothetical protein